MASLLAIFYQDQKDRLVYWWLFLVGALGLSVIHINAVGWLQYGIHSAFNSGLVLLMLLVLIGYIKIRMQTFSLQNVLGIGDIFFLFALALGFATLSFVTLLVFGFIFSLIIHLVFQKFTLSRKHTKDISMHKEKTVPLAGYLSLFFAGVLLVHWLGFYDNLYVI
ncbi:hypothetical protein [Dokdonia sp.]|uniref:hypothetical protein n=1 Tax=Dokdonia sp. TaxID=2024995 RepID=UPI003262E270